MNNLIYGIIGFGIEIANAANAINMIDEKTTVNQNKVAATVATIAGVIGGMYLGIYIEKYHQEKKSKEEAKKITDNISDEYKIK